jgi:hypothetical protein
MKMAWKIELDFAVEVFDDAMQLLRQLHDINASVRVVSLHGPGGGNPVLEFTFQTYDAMKAMVLEYCGGDTETADDVLESAEEC